MGIARLVHFAAPAWALMACGPPEVGSAVREDIGVGIAVQEIPLADDLNQIFAPFNTAAQLFSAGTCLVKLKDHPTEEPLKEEDVKPNTIAVRLSISYAQNRSQVDQSFAVGGSAEFGNRLTRGNVDLLTSNSTKSDALSLYSTRLLMDNEQLSAPEPEEQAALRRAARVMSQCGNSYVHLAKRGVTASITIIIRARQTETKNQIEAKASAAFKTPLFDAQAIAGLTRLRNDLGTSVKFDAVVYTEGFIPNLPQMSASTRTRSRRCSSSSGRPARRRTRPRSTTPRRSRPGSATTGTSRRSAGSSPGIRAGRWCTATLSGPGSRTP